MYWIIDHLAEKEWKDSQFLMRLEIFLDMTLKREGVSWGEINSVSIKQELVEIP